MGDTTESYAGPRTVTTERLRAIASCFGGSLSASAWPAVLSARGLVTLPEGDHASWLPVSFELTWRRPPPGSGVDVEAHILDEPERGEGPLTVVRSIATIEGVEAAEVTMVAQLRSEPNSSYAGDTARPGDRAERTSRTITEAEVIEFCEALGTTPWSSEGHGWAGVRPRPQMVVPITLLAGHAVQLLGQEPKTIVAAAHAQVLCGAVHHWVHDPDHPQTTWVVTANGDPVLQFLARPLDS